MRKHYYIDLGSAPDSAALHKALRAQLPLPDYYGDNLDAFYDVLTEFGSKWTLVFRGAAPAAFRALCADAVRDTPGLVIRFVRG